MDLNDPLDAELRALEERVGQLAQLVRRLRQENTQLRDASSAASS